MILLFQLYDEIKKERPESQNLFIRKPIESEELLKEVNRIISLA
jgi:hypothetical protein